MALFYVALVVAVLAAGVVVYSKFHKKVDAAVSVVKDEVGEVEKAASDVKKDLSA